MTHLRLNFRNQQTVEVLPPGERRLQAAERQSVRFRGWQRRHAEVAGDEFWLGQYLKVIE